ncbi:methyltransferase domain-containing protein, partial [Syncephalis pseudoplumigaleata]
ISEHVLYGMNPKKIHEVERLAWMIAQLARSREIRQIVDLGSGQGYLSRSLAYQYGLDVLAMDADNVQTCGAQRYQAQAERHGIHSNTADASDDAIASTARGRLIHATHLVTERSLNELLQAIHKEDSDHWRGEGDASEGSAQPWLLCGLHTCGDLGASSLRLFVESDARILVNVGCCYNLLT